MLGDHFRPPLSRCRHWSGFLSHWASGITTDLNQRLPPDLFAEPFVQWAASQRTDIVEVRIHRDYGDVPLVGVIELVSPANKDRPETRDAFISKCDNYLRDSIGLVIVDIVTERDANLHSLLVNRAGDSEDRPDSIYTSAYRPLRQNGDQTLSIWYDGLAIGGSVPAMPLFLRDGPLIRVNLDETYLQTCEQPRIRATGEPDAS